MNKYLRIITLEITKGLGILAGRIREQGLKTTFVWMTVQGISNVTGIPLLKYCQITPRVFIGPQFRHLGKQLLTRNGIYASVSLRSEFDDADHGLAMKHYCYLPTHDGDVPTLEQVKQGVSFIQRVIERGDKVYIHCAQGVGRAPTLAAAYFIQQGYTPDDAIRLIRNRRPFIRITPAQMDILRNWKNYYEE